jgi:hypothetical protein
MHTALFEDDCGVCDTLRRERGVPMVNANGNHQQRRVGRSTENKWSALVLASAERRGRGERCAGGGIDARRRQAISCAEREQMGGRKLEADAPRTRLKERLDGTSYVRVIALGVAHACAI